jgi:hypothetical protein
MTVLSSRLTPSQSDASLTVLWEWRGWGQGGGGHLYVATEKNVKIAKVHSIIPFWHEDLVKTKFCRKVHEKTKDEASYYN